MRDDNLMLKKNHFTNTTTYPRKRKRSTDSMLSQSLNDADFRHLDHSKNDRLKGTPDIIFTDVIKDNSLVIENPYRQRSATTPNTNHELTIDYRERSATMPASPRLLHADDDSPRGRSSSVLSHMSNDDPRMRPFKQRRFLIGSKRRRAKPSDEVTFCLFCF